ncbi:MAG: hypothetical protein IJM02_06320 [Clostridia bacterium]|nr:hypothetical protein [Clostridia bacterium]
MIFPVIFAAIGMIMLIVFQYYRIKGCTPWTTVLKSFTSLGFMCVAVCALATNGFGKENARYCAFVILALLFGLLGDIWLDLKFTHPECGIPYTYAGFMVFLFGHLVYDAGLISRFYVKGHPMYIIVPVLISLAFCVVVLFTEDLMKVKYGKFKAIVAAYSPVVISISAFSGSFALLHNFKEIPLNIFFVASVLFLFSDLILNGTYFGDGKNRPVDVIVNHTSYYLAQYAIALSLCFLK